VISKNVELKKLVYIYLEHYAEVEPDAALLAVNSFQKDLNSSSQLIRASAMRVLSSIRVKIIVQIIVLAIQKCSKDISPYVRKSACHAVSKVYGLDKEQKDALTEIVKSLLNDKSVLVLGSAMAAFSEVCPDNWKVIHPHFRKLCKVLADVDEWGQISIINVLIRYGRNQFENPEKETKDKPKKPKKEKKLKFFNDDEGSDEEEEEEEEDELEDEEDDYHELDPDHRLLLNSALPLLNSRNTGVVMAVASLYYYLAPQNEAQKVTKALIRIMKSKREIQYVVLANIATMAATRPTMFEPCLSEFFIMPSDPSWSRTLKLEIVTSIVNQDNINKILQEFRRYVGREEKGFVTATIQAIGRCASRVPETADRCLHGLMSLVSDKSDQVVADSVVVIKKLLQMLINQDPEEHAPTIKSVVSHLSKLLENIKVPLAKASIVWVIGEYSHIVPQLAPDILRKLAKSFANEDSAVKLQIMNLGTKLFLSNPSQSSKIFDYVLNLAKYDVNYDVRDRCRVIRKILYSNTNPDLQAQALKLFMSKKPIPLEQNPSHGRQRFQLGTLSHLLNHTSIGYIQLEDFPDQAPSRDARDEVIMDTALPSDTGIPSNGADWDFEEDGEDEDSYTTESEENEEGENSWFSEEEESGSYTTEEEESEEEPPPKKAPKKKAAPPPVKTAPPPVKTAPPPQKKKQPAKNQESLDDLFNMDFEEQKPSSPVKSPTPKSNSMPSNGMEDFFGSSSNGNHSASISSPFTPSTQYTMLKHVVGGGLGIEYSYSRAPSMHGAMFNTLELTFKNHSNKPINNIKIGKMQSDGGMEIIAFQEIPTLVSMSTLSSQMSIKFSSVSKPAKFEISTSQGTYNITLVPFVGDLVRAGSMSLSEFSAEEKKLKGMHEASDNLILRGIQNLVPKIPQIILETAYLSAIQTDFDTGSFKFAGRTNIDDNPILVSLEVNKEAQSAKCTVHSENTVLNSMLLKQLKQALTQ